MFDSVSANVGRLHVKFHQIDHRNPQAFTFEVQMNFPLKFNF